MATVNEELFDRAVSHQIGLIRLSAGTVKKIQSLLDKVDRDLLRKVQARAGSGGEFTTARLDALIRDMREIAGEARSATLAKATDELKALAQYEVDFQLRNIERELRIKFELTKPTANTLRAIVTQKPMQGHLLKEWVAQLDQAKVRRITQAIRIGMAEGEGIDQIVRRIRGTKALRYRDGVLDISRRGAEAMVRTAVNHVSTAARELLYAENDDLIKGVRWVSTLDARTSAICRARDGAVYPPGEGPRPPAHINCRSTTVPVTKSWRELGLDAKELPEGTRASMNGQVPEGLTYDTWLRRQSTDFQNEVLGPKKADLFRAGLTLDKFVDVRGRELTLAELQRIEVVHEVAKDELRGLSFAETGVSIKAKEEMAKTWKSFPEHVRDSIVKAGVETRVTRMLVDEIPSLSGQHPGGWPSGSTWENVEGVFHSGVKKSVTAQFYKRLMGGAIAMSTRMESTLAHESGHAFDFSIGWASGRPDFLLEYAADLKAIPAKLTKEGGDLAYFAQPGAAGPKEAFAETFAEALGKGSTGLDVSSYFRRTAAFVKKLL